MLCGHNRHVYLFDSSTRTLTAGFHITLYTNTNKSLVYAAELALLVVDDRKDDRELLHTALSLFGYQDIRLAGDADSALTLLRERPADVVLLDWMMPVVSGLVLTKRIRQLDSESERYTAIVMVSGLSSGEDLMRAVVEGADDYLRKPIDMQELPARIYAAGRTASIRNSLLQAYRDLRGASERWRHQASTDALTGLANRRVLMQRLEQWLSSFTQVGGVLCLAMVDLDYFKQVNDTYGHKVGDEVLNACAKRLIRAFRPEDIIARFGGEEFAIALYQPQPFDSQEVFIRSYQQLSERPIRTSAGVIPVTASYGVYCVSPDDLPLDVDTLINRADERLYKAKAAGRNQVVFT